MSASTAAALLAAAALLLGAAPVLAEESAPPAATTAPSCSEFAAQADAQAAFAELGGSPGHPVGGLDPDRDGLACEGLPAPYGFYATIGYNRRGHFLYGTAALPPAARAAAGYPCLRGNRKGPLGPRRLSVRRAAAGGDRAIVTRIHAEADPENGRLLWKAPRPSLAPGRYYAAFEESIRSTPYGRNPCPGFRSREVPLPRPRQAAS